MAANFALRAGVIVHAPKMIAIGHGREGAVERENFQPVARKIELPNNLRTKQRNYVRTLREEEPRKDFFGDGSATQNMTAFEDEHLLPCFGKVGSVDEAVVAAADDNDVVVLRHAE